MPVAGGEPRKLTSLKEDVTQAVWSPDGTRIAFVARVRDAAYDEEDDKKRRPRRLTRLQYKLDSVGWTADRPQHLFVVPADGSSRAGAAHRRRLRRPLAVLVAGRRDHRLRLRAPPGLGPRDGERRVPGGRRRRRAAAAHAGRRHRRRPLVVAGRDAAGRRALRRRVRRPEAHADRARRRRDGGDFALAHRRARPQLRDRTRACASRSGTATTSCSSSRTTAARTSTASPPTAPASRVWSSAASAS